MAKSTHPKRSAKATGNPFQQLKALAATLPAQALPGKAPQTQNQAAHTQAAHTQAAQGAPARTLPTPPRSDPATDYVDFAAGVVPLQPDRRGRAHTSPLLGNAPQAKPAVELRATAEAFATAAHESAHAELVSLVSGANRFEVLDDGYHTEGLRVGVDRKALQALRRDELVVDATLDLHGLRLEEARRRVHQFVEEKARLGERILRIVVGKGLHSASGIPVLRGEVAAWLSSGNASRYVQAFAGTPEQGEIRVFVATH